MQQCEIMRGSPTERSPRFFDYPVVLRPLRMRIRVVRTSGWLAACSDADPVQPRGDVAARPHAAPGMLSLSLNSIIHAPGIIRPVERETVADEPLTQISVAHSRAQCGLRFCAHSIPAQNESANAISALSASIRRAASSGVRFAAYCSGW